MPATSPPGPKRKPKKITQAALPMAVLTAPSFRPSTYQEDVYEWVVAAKGDGIIHACAGAGKTSTLVEVAQLLPRGKALFCAFNKHIVAELRERLQGTDFDVQTLHGIGYRTLLKAFPQLVIDKQKYRRLCRSWVDTRLRRLPRAQLVSPDAGALPRLRLFPPSNCRNGISRSTAGALYPPHTGRSRRPEALRAVARRFGIVVDAAIFPGVRAVLDDGIALTRRAAPSTTPICSGCRRCWISSLIAFAGYSSMNVRTLTPHSSRWRCAAGRVGGRMLFCGDPFQSIMAFSGADPEAYAHIKASTGATELPLSICYRCPTSHLDLARELVPTIEARPTLPQVSVITLQEVELPAHLQAGDLVLCRYNAPLVAWAIRLIAARMPARVKGRDVVADLSALARKLAALVPGGALARPSTPMSRSGRPVATGGGRGRGDRPGGRPLPDPTHVSGRVPAHVGRCALRCIDGLFSDEQATIWLSTIHRAKGLEAERVFLLEANTLATHLAAPARRLRPAGAQYPVCCADAGQTGSVPGAHT